MNKKKNAGFTLIELMVVVAIIAILAVLGVTSFSSAIKRSRNAVVQSDVNTFAKAMETCFNPLTGVYAVANGTAYAAAKTALTTNQCLQENSITSADGKFTFAISGSPQTFTICGQLEAVGVNASGVANSSNATGTACGSATNCLYFCVKNMQ